MLAYLSHLSDKNLMCLIHCKQNLAKWDFPPPGLKWNLPTVTQLNRALEEKGGSRYYGVQEATTAAAIKN